MRIPRCLALLAAAGALAPVPNTARRRRVVCRAADWTQSEDWALTDGAKRFTRSSRTGDERLFYEDLAASLGPAAGARDGVRDAVLTIIESSCPSSDRDRTLAPRPRVRCSFVSLVAGAGVAALPVLPFLWVARLPVAGVRGGIRDGRELRARPRHFMAPRPVFAASTCSLL